MTLRAPAALLLALACAGCGPRPDPVPVSAEERSLLDKLVADRFVEIETIERSGGADGPLLVTTRQGDVRVRYLVSPTLRNARGVPGILRINDRSELATAANERPGSGPAARR